MRVAAEVFERGTCYSLEHCDHLLGDAATLYGARAYPSAEALALLAREELGGYRIPLNL